MVDIQELIDRRAALVAARTTGALRTTFRSGGTERTIEFKSDQQMAASIRFLDGEIARHGRAPINTFLPTFSKGL
ncbi:MAG: phage head-tail joining protein [Devosia sp.]